MHHFFFTYNIIYINYEFSFLTGNIPLYNDIIMFNPIINSLLYNEFIYIDRIYHKYT